MSGSTLIRVGHKGADHVTPGNTAASFAAALDCGVDMIEFDVMPMPDGRLVLAHDPEDATGRDPLTLAEGLDHLAHADYAGIELVVDMKARGYEQEVVAELHARELGERAVLSTHYLESLALVGDLAPEIRRGWSVPNVKRDYTQSLLLKLPAAVAVLWMRARIPGRASRAIRAGRCEMLMAHHLLVSGRLARSVHEVGGQLFVWTVDEAEHIARLERLGADAVISNDPRLFDVG